MPIVQNNNFTLDTLAMRAERLSAIQANFASIQPELQAPAHIVAWSEDCNGRKLSICEDNGHDALQGFARFIDF